MGSTECQAGTLTSHQNSCYPLECGWMGADTVTARGEKHKLGNVCIQQQFWHIRSDTDSRSSIPECSLKGQCTLDSSFLWIYEWRQLSGVNGACVGEVSDLRLPVSGHHEDSPECMRRCVWGRGGAWGSPGDPRRSQASRKDCKSPSKMLVIAVSKSCHFTEF
jgi:hypothetical protein